MNPHLWNVNKTVGHRFCALCGITAAGARQRDEWECQKPLQPGDVDPTTGWILLHGGDGSWKFIKAGSVVLPWGHQVANALKHGWRMDPANPASLAVCRDL